MIILIRSMVSSFALGITTISHSASDFLAKKPIGNFNCYDRKERKCTELTRPVSTET